MTYFKFEQQDRERAWIKTSFAVGQNPFVFFVYYMTSPSIVGEYRFINRWKSDTGVLVDEIAVGQVGNYEKYIYLANVHRTEEREHEWGVIHFSPQRLEDLALIKQRISEHPKIWADALSQYRERHRRTVKSLFDIFCQESETRVNSMYSYLRRKMFDKLTDSDLKPSYASEGSIEQLPYSWFMGSSDTSSKWLEYQTTLDFMRDLDGLAAANGFGTMNRGVLENIRLGLRHRYAQLLPREESQVQAA